MAVELPEKMERVIANAPAEWYKTREMTPESLRTFMEQRVLRDERSPKIGEDAPDLELELLTGAGGRTGETVTLSGYFGKPVALIFGSYT